MSSFSTVPSNVQKDTGATTFEELFARYDKMIYNICLSRVDGNIERAEDLTQDLKLRIFEKAHTFRGESNFKTWLHSVINNYVNHSFRQWRKEGRDVSLDTPRDPDEDAPVWEVPVADRRLSSALTRITIHDAISKLPRKEQTLVILHMRGGCSYEELATVTGLPIGTVKNRLFRIRAKLREILTHRIH